MRDEKNRPSFEDKVACALYGQAPGDARSMPRIGVGRSLLIEYLGSARIISWM